MSKTISLAALDATKASANAFEFEYLKDGSSTGVFFSVLGGESEVVAKEVASLLNERRRKQAAREIKAKIGTGAKTVEFDSVESDTEFGQRLAAVRLVGWRGITEPFNAENALRLCQSNRDIASQIVAASDESSNFIKL